MINLLISETKGMFGTAFLLASQSYFLASPTKHIWMEQLLSKSYFQFLSHAPFSK